MSAALVWLCASYGHLYPAAVFTDTTCNRVAETVATSLPAFSAVEDTRLCFPISKAFILPSLNKVRFHWRFRSFIPNHPVHLHFLKIEILLSPQPTITSTPIYTRFPQRPGPEISSLLQPYSTAALPLILGEFLRIFNPFPCQQTSAQAPTALRLLTDSPARGGLFRSIGGAAPCFSTNYSNHALFHHLTLVLQAMTWMLATNPLLDVRDGS
jgi:hypothetical protein